MRRGEGRKYKGNPKIFCKNFRQYYCSTKILISFFRVKSNKLLIKDGIMFV